MLSSPTIPPTQNPHPGRGKKLSGQEKGKKEAKRNGGCVTEILLAIEIILFLFVCELFIYLLIYFFFFFFFV